MKTKNLPKRSIPLNDDEAWDEITRISNSVTEKMDRLMEEIRDEAKKITEMKKKEFHFRIFNGDYKFFQNYIFELYPERYTKIINKRKK